VANSRERLEAFLRLLGEIGLEYVVVGRKFFGPPLGLTLRRGPLMPYQPISEDSFDRWVAAWPELPMPGMSGQCAFDAVEQDVNLPIVEAALRELEHDASARMQAGFPAPDVDEVRELLAMPVGAWFNRADLSTAGIGQ
jgi:hypothetical protein